MSIPSIKMVIELNNIYKTYPGVRSTSVLRGITLSVDKGEFISIMGESGSGKTTLLNIIGLMDSFDSGAYLFECNDVGRLSSADLACIRNKSIGFVFQSFNLIPHKSVVENVALPLMYAGYRRKDAIRKASEIMERLGIEFLSHKMPSIISGGERQRVAVARAIVMSPSLILADEPTGALDTISAEILFSLLSDINKDFRTTIILVTHNRIIAERTQRILSIEDGIITKVQ